MKAYPDQVCKAVGSQWDSDAALASLVPGGLWWEEPQAVALFPYARLFVEEKSVEFFSGETGLQTWAITLGVYSKEALTDSGAIQKKIDTLFRRERRSEIVFDAAGVYVLDLRPTTDGASKHGFDDAKNVVAAEKMFDLVLQVNF